MGSLEGPGRTSTRTFTRTSPSTFARQDTRTFKTAPLTITCRSPQVYRSRFITSSKTRRYVLSLIISSCIHPSHRPRRTPNPCCFHTTRSQRSPLPYGTQAPLKIRNPPPATSKSGPFISPGGFSTSLHSNSNLSSSFETWLQLKQ